MPEQREREERHTPGAMKLPLRWDADYAYAFIFDADDRVVAFLGDTKAAVQPFDWHEVAAFIVRAANGHDGLLAASGEALAMCHDHHHNFHYYTRKDELAGKLRAAIDKAAAR